MTPESEYMTHLKFGYAQMIVGAGFFSIRSSEQSASKDKKHRPSTCPHHGLYFALHTSP